MGFGSREKVPAPPGPQQALDCHQQAFGRQHPLVARDLYGLAQVALAQEDLLGAESLLQEAEQILQQTYDEAHQLACIYADQAQIFWRTQRRPEALAAMQWAFQMPSSSGFTLPEQNGNGPSSWADGRLYMNK